MKVIVIPDVHLKPWMYERATEYLRNGTAERAVCLMDIPDDWNQEMNISLYEETFDAAILFAKEFPDTLWCYGNHDICYLIDGRESGYSAFAADTVSRKLWQLQQAAKEPIRYIQKIDDVIFCHGGLTDYFVDINVDLRKRNDIDYVIDLINNLPMRNMWNNDSPVWHRPQYEKLPMYMSDKLLQVVGHTPVSSVQREANLISTDVFSSYRDGHPIGTEEFLLLDTVTWEYAYCQ